MTRAFNCLSPTDATAVTDYSGLLFDERKKSSSIFRGQNVQLQLYILLHKRFIGSFLQLQLQLQSTDDWRLQFYEIKKMSQTAVPACSFILYYTAALVSRF